MRVFRFDEVDSTNKYLKEREELQEYDCVIAKTQTAGVGRRGNVWVSNEGMAIFSFTLKEDKNISLEEYMRLPLIAGISVLKGLKKTEDLDYKFKWTNDIYLQDRKICGILVEKIRDFFIIGIGVNVNNEDFGYAQDRAISLKSVTGNFYPTEDIIFCIINEFKSCFAEEWKYLLKEINSYNYLNGKEIEIVKYGESIGKGIAKEIAFDGRLIVEIDGEDKLFNIGEIHIKK